MRRQGRGGRSAPVSPRERCSTRICRPRVGRRRGVPLGDAGRQRAVPQEGDDLSQHGLEEEPVRTIRVSRNAVKAHLSTATPVGPCSTATFTVCHKAKGKDKAKRRIKAKGAKAAAGTFVTATSSASARSRRSPQAEGEPARKGFREEGEGQARRQARQGRREGQEAEEAIAPAWRGTASGEQPSRARSSRCVERAARARARGRRASSSWSSSRRSCRGRALRRRRRRPCRYRRRGGPVHHGRRGGRSPCRPRVRWTQRCQ